MKVDALKILFILHIYIGQIKLQVLRLLCLYPKASIDEQGMQVGFLARARLIQSVFLSNFQIATQTQIEEHRCTRRRALLRREQDDGCRL